MKICRKDLSSFWIIRGIEGLLERVEEKNPEGPKRKMPHEFKGNQTRLKDLMWEKLHGKRERQDLCTKTSFV